MSKKRKSRSQFSRVRHPFLYKIESGSGSVTVHKVYAKVRHAKKPVVVILTAEHVEQSIKLHGAGDTSKCSGAICTYAHADKFPHPVEGHVDWNYTRAFLVSKPDNRGFPAECYGYEHNARDIAMMNDSPGGQQKLLKMLRTDGPRAITFQPIRYRSELGRPGRNRKGSGVRDPMKKRGAHLRYAVYQLGAQPKSDTTKEAKVDERAMT